jgi:hypothetical protein
MFKYESIVEEVKVEVSLPSFQVIDLAHANGLVDSGSQQHWIDACYGVSSCYSCSHTTGCVGCTNSFHTLGSGDGDEPITKADLLQAITG